MQLASHPSGEPRRAHTAFDVAVHDDWGWRVNGRDIGRLVERHLDARVRAADVGDWGAAACPFCRVPLDRQVFEVGGEAEAAGRSTRAERRHERDTVLKACARCAYWEFQGYEGGPGCIAASSLVLAQSVAATFAPDFPVGCAQELAQHLRRHPTDWHAISPTALERLVADVFRSAHARCEVRHVGGPGDLGVDVVFVDDGGTTWLIQVKRRARADRAEGFATLQSVLGTLLLEGRRHALIVTTADAFSHQAYRERARAAARGFTVELWDKGVLDRVVGHLLPAAPWRALFRHDALASFGGDLRAAYLARAAALQLDLLAPTPPSPL